MFCDDLSFDSGDTTYKSLKAVLEGGIEGRPDNVLFYATSNRRHLMPRDMIENERQSAIHPGEAVEEKVSLSDRFGLWLGFHPCSQDDYLAMVRGYVDHFGITIAPDRCGARRWSGRRPAAPAPAASPGNTSRISPAARARLSRADVSRRADGEVDVGALVVVAAAASRTARSADRGDRGDLLDHRGIAGRQPGPGMSSAVEGAVISCIRAIRRQQTSSAGPVQRYWVLATAVGSRTRTVSGSIGGRPLRSSKWSWLRVASPVEPTRAMTWPRATRSPTSTSSAALWRVGRDVAVGVAEQDQAAIAADPVAGIGDEAVLGRQHGRALARRDVDAVAALARVDRPEAADHLAVDRPEEALAAERRRRAAGGCRRASASAAPARPPTSSASGRRSFWPA